MSKHTVLIHNNVIDGVSSTFSVEEQATIYAAGLHEGDSVSLEMVLISDPVKADPCGCPPGNVVLPGVIDVMPLTCCGAPITLTRQRPFIIIDAPLQQLLRVRLTQADPNLPLDTQRVWMRPTKTANVNDRLRGCPCGADQ